MRPWHSRLIWWKILHRESIIICLNRFFYQTHKCISHLTFLKAEYVIKLSKSICYCRPNFIYFIEYFNNLSSRSLFVCTNAYYLPRPCKTAPNRNVKRNQKLIDFPHTHKTDQNLPPVLHHCPMAVPPPVNYVVYQIPNWLPKSWSPVS